MSHDPRIDEYIEKAPPFAKPVLKHLRKLVHDSCPEVVENIRWGFPHFDHKGIVCSMAAFKRHCSFGFWKGTVLKDSKELLIAVGATNMATFDKITSLDDLPTDEVLIAYIREAVRLNEDKIKVAGANKKAKKAELPIPEELRSALNRNQNASATFEKLSPSHKREYIEWIAEAKTDATREKRIDTTIEWLTDGKSRHWKHQE